MYALLVSIYRIILILFEGLVRVCELIYSFGIQSRKGVTLGEDIICVIELFSRVMYVDRFKYFHGAAILNTERFSKVLKVGMMMSVFSLEITLRCVYRRTDVESDNNAADILAMTPQGTIAVQDDSL